MIDTAYTAWQDDLADGKATLLIAETAETVRELNERARADRILTGHTYPGRTARLADGLEVSAGDLVITRRNRRRLTTGRDLVAGGFVRNGDRWQVQTVHRGGSLDVRRIDVDGTGRLGDTVTLPAGYVAQHVDLGYAVTAHRAQGMTVDTAHVLVTAITTRENLCVALTRGRAANHAYIATDRPDASHTPPDDGATYRSVLFGVLQHRGAELSAHQVRDTERERWTGRDRLLAEYNHIADVARRPRWTRLVTEALVAGGFTPDDARAHPSPDGGALGQGAGVDTSRATAFDALCRELRRAGAYGWDVNGLLPQLARRRVLLDADNPCAALFARLRQATSKSARGASPRLLVGAVPEATGPVPDDFRPALGDRSRRLAEPRLSTAHGESRALMVRVVACSRCEAGRAQLIGQMTSAIPNGTVSRPVPGTSTWYRL